MAGSKQRDPIEATWKQQDGSIVPAIVRMVRANFSGGG
jgi:hypothetical protein